MSETQTMARTHQAERAARMHEAAAEKLRARLASSIAAEERRAKRNADAYARVKRTLVASKGIPLEEGPHINRFTWVFCNLTCMGLCCWAPAQDLPVHVCMYRRVVCRAGDRKGRVTAGAVSAALRELRPVEIVGVYEDTIEGLKVMQQELLLEKSMHHMPKLV